MKRILVIDDDAILLKTVKAVLAAEGYDVATADDGVEGLDLYDQGGFDLVITDILMPNKNGIKTISHIRKVDTETPILAISGANETGTLNNLMVARMVGATETLAKPFEKKALLGCVKDCWAEN